MQLSISIAALGLAFASHLLAGHLIPLATGNRWSLANNAGAEMVLTATSVERIGPNLRARIRVNSPFLNTTLIVRSYDGKGLWVEGTGSEGRWARYAEPLPFLPESEVGASNKWEGGSSVLLSTAAAVAAAGRVHAGVRLYEVRFGNEMPQHWFINEDAGFLQFGLGADSFVLRSASLHQSDPEAVASEARACPVVGIEPNPLRDFSAPSRKATLQHTVEAGTRFSMVSVAWAEVEPSPGKYVLDEIGEYVSWAGEFGLDVSLTIKTADTLGASMPSDLVGRAWNDPEVMDRFRALLMAINERLSQRVHWINLANEVDASLSSQPEALVPFREFYLAGKRTMRELRPEVSLGVVFAYDTFRTNESVFRALEDEVDHVAFTYYGVNPARPAGGPVHRHLSNLPFDLADIYSAAAGRQIIFTELGRASSPEVLSSPEEQAEFYASILHSIRTSGGKVAAASFSFYSDVPPLTAFLLSLPFGPTDGPTLMRWFGSLGVVDRRGGVKPAWDAYRSAALAMAEPESCR